MEDLPSKSRRKKSRVAILVSDKMDFKPTKIKRDKEGHYIMVKGSIQQEELTILNIYAPNTGTPSIGHCKKYQIVKTTDARKKLHQPMGKISS